MQLKLLIRHPIYWQQAQRILKQKSPGDFVSDAPPIALDLYGTDLLLDCGRHVYSLAHYSQLAGSRFVIRSGRVMLSSIVKKQFGRLAVAMPHVSWVAPESPLPADALVLRDAPVGVGARPMPKPHPVEMLIGRDRPPEYPVMPYPMHPGTLTRVSDRRLAEYRLRSRHGILFAGRVESRYQRNGMSEQFQVTNRGDVVRVLSTLAQENSSIVIRDSSTDPIDPSQWLDCLASHDFFVCAPGVAQPICHNLVEAMSVGTIPILEYGSRLTPALIDGVEAIGFHGQTGLAGAVARANGLGESEKQFMRAKVIEYFKTHLRCENFLAGLRDTPTESRPKRIVMPFHNENYFSSDCIAA